MPNSEYYFISETIFIKMGTRQKNCHHHYYLTFGLWYLITGILAVRRWAGWEGVPRKETFHLQKVSPRASPTAHLKKRDILSQELGQVDVKQGPQEQDTLILFWVLELEVASGSEHRLDSAHAIVIVVLRGELLRAQAVSCHNLLGKTRRQLHIFAYPQRGSCPSHHIFPTSLCPAPSKTRLAHGLDEEALSYEGLLIELP